jgi:hypothetical protein
MSLEYAGLHQLCAPVLERRERLPAPQRDALSTAFGLTSGPTPDPFVVGLALLGLLTEVASERPLVCVVDDAQWLDSASSLALAFVARRLQAESIGLVFAVRDPRKSREFSGFSELSVGGLNPADARSLLESALTGRLDERVQDRIVRESHGNPRFLLDLTPGVAPVELAGGYALPDVMPSVNGIGQSFTRRLDSMPAQTQQLLLIAATEPLGAADVFWRAARRLGLGADAAAPAVAAGLIDIGTDIRFSHPLLRAAVYRAASLPDRREAHRALAEATDPEADPDGRARHWAHAAYGPDEKVAAELERAAGWAAARGGVAAEAAFLGWAAELTPDHGRRGQRAVTAAQAKLQAGGFEQATSMLSAGETEPLDAVQIARVAVTRARIAFAQGRCNAAAPLLLAAARSLEGRDAALARETYAYTIRATMFAGQLTSGPSLLEVARTVRAAAATPRAHGGDMLLDALAARLIDGDAAALLASQLAMQAFCDDYTLQEELPLLWLASATAADLWDDRRWDTFTARHVTIARESGALGELPLALTSRVYVHLFAGELTEAGSLVREAQTVSEATGSNLVTYGAIGLAACQGREDEVRRLVDATIGDAVARGEGIGITVTHWAKALLFNGLCRYEDALAAPRRRRSVNKDSAGRIGVRSSSSRLPCGAVRLTWRFTPLSGCAK